MKAFTINNLQTYEISTYIYMNIDNDYKTIKML